VVIHSGGACYDASTKSANQLRSSIKQRHSRPPTTTTKRCIIKQPLVKIRGANSTTNDAVWQAVLYERTQSEESLTVTVSPWWGRDGRVAQVTESIIYIGREAGWRSVPFNCSKSRGFSQAVTRIMYYTRRGPFRNAWTKTQCRLRQCLHCLCLLALPYLSSFSRFLFGSFSRKSCAYIRRVPSWIRCRQWSAVTSALPCSCA